MGRPQPKSKPKRRNSKLPRRRSKPKRRRKTPTKKPKRQARSNSFDHGSARRSSLALPSYPRLLTFNFSPSNLAACPASSQSDSEAIPPRNHANGAEICFLALAEIQKRGLATKRHKIHKIICESCASLWPLLPLLEDLRPRERQQDVPCPAGNDQFFMNGIKSDS